MLAAPKLMACAIRTRLVKETPQFECPQTQPKHSSAAANTQALMKILELRLQNLNSLVGEWRLDFSAPEFQDTGLFLLSGPTGAGKSTILDAICLALYGATPRLGTITSKNNEIMARTQNSCYSEVVFATRRGRYRCRWEQRRARAGGKFGEARHELSDADTGTIVASQKRSTARAVEAQTGMDFERFTRAMLLAQGAFDSFLRASTEDKSAVLEQITGSEIYSQISILCHERRRAEREALQQLEAQSSALTVLSAEQLELLQQQLEQQRAQRQDLQRQVQESEQTVAWRQNVDALQRELAALRQQAEELQAQSGQLQELWQGSQRQLEAAKAELSRSAPLLQQARALDLQLQHQSQSLDSLQNECAQLERQLEQNQQRQAELRRRQQQLEAKSRRWQDYRQGHEQDSDLGAELPLLNEQCQQLERQRRQVLSHREQRSAAEQDLELAQQQLAASEQELAANSQALQSLSSEIERRQQLLNELLRGQPLSARRADKARLERERDYLRKIASLEAERARLVAGEACPLCGAREHPFASGEVPELDPTERAIVELEQLIVRCEALEEQLLKLREQQSQAQQQRALVEARQTTAANDRRHAEQRRQQAQQLGAQERELGERLSAEISGKLGRYGIKASSAAEATAALAQLGERWQSWHRGEQEQSSVTAALTELQSELTSLVAVGANLQTSLTPKRSERERRRQELEQTQEQRRLLFGGRAAELVEDELQRQLHAAEQAEAQAAQDYQRLHDARTKLQAVQQDKQSRRAELAAQRSDTATLEQLRAGLEQQQQRLQQLSDSCAQLNQQLEADRLARVQRWRQQRRVARQRQQYQRWSQLHELIGSADGKKYRNFAQALSFELMVRHANAQLRQLSDRYVLIQQAHSPLELQVIDNYQAGEIRPTKNLSGGESFLVSLSLALGLARMASSNAPVDSLFLDEGFGTLDEDSLETALGALVGLQQEQKLIGVISHVPALKERIATQIHISPVANGRSAVSGPGCSKIA